MKWISYTNTHPINIRPTLKIKFYSAPWGPKPENKRYSLFINHSMKEYAKETKLDYIQFGIDESRHVIALQYTDDCTQLSLKNPDGTFRTIINCTSLFQLLQKSLPHLKTDVFYTMKQIDETSFETEVQ